MSDPRTPRRSSRAILLVGLSVWVGLIAVAWTRAVDWSSQPGAQSAAPATWPASSQLALAARPRTMLVFAHPKCPCTRATLRELEKIAARGVDQVDLRILFCVPTEAPAGWELGSLWIQAQAIPGATVHADHGSREARLFGAETSGTVVLYDSGGSLLFHGGITAARGHEGDSAGRTAVLASVVEGSPCSRSAPVFGCPIETCPLPGADARPTEGSP